MNERHSNCVEDGEHHGKMEALQKQLSATRETLRDTVRAGEVFIRERDEARAILAEWMEGATYLDEPVSPGARRANFQALARRTVAYLNGCDKPEPVAEVTLNDSSGATK